MGKQMKWMIAALIVLLALFAINSYQQGKYNATSDRVFDLERENIFAFEISKGDEFISLSFDGESWYLDEHDSLTVKSNTVNSFLNTILSLKKTSLVSTNSSKWDKFMVGDSTGTHLKLLDHDQQALGKITVGRSNAEWSSSNIRIGDQPEVYHSSENITWQMNPSPTYWGEVIKPDSSSGDPID
ncbi:MAG: DUF4340 domain-containing protein [Candidatus Neomarinimicrobiota bacterium]|jgi:hypothetical protein|nr:DUF4340 domain-containing protein [Candidatus Neomarinimicrobiota bacterium]MEE3302607.1 DUF4340 domain-containing protein [Candidatus Neomarinimicrobiota bacterium]|tara:strand:- start:510 stop:1064 length:555 start_codon:yes stop_codon:yes gene_type:complete